MWKVTLLGSTRTIVLFNNTNFNIHTNRKYFKGLYLQSLESEAQSLNIKKEIEIYYKDYYLLRKVSVGVGKVSVIL